MKDNKLILVVLLAVLVLMPACTKEGSSGVVDGTRWNGEAVQMVNEVRR
jgi:hypothetical protein